MEDPSGKEPRANDDFSVRILRETFGLNDEELESLGSGAFDMEKHLDRLVAEQAASTPDCLLTPEKVAERLGIVPTTARLWMRSGKLPGVKKIGPRGLLRISESALAAYIENSPTVTPVANASPSNAATKANASRTPEQRSEASR